MERIFVLLGAFVFGIADHWLFNEVLELDRSASSFVSSFDHSIDLSHDFVVYVSRISDLDIFCRRNQIDPS